MINSNIEQAKIVFKQANGFFRFVDGMTFKVGNILYLNPYYINCLFCCELYMKSLLLYEGKTVAELRKANHKLLDLFNMLSYEDQTTLKTAFKMDWEYDLFKHLDKINNDFVNMRYVYINNDKMDIEYENNKFATTISFMYMLQLHVSMRLFGKDTYEDVKSEC